MIKNKVEGLNVLLVMLSLGLILFKWQQLPPEVPIFYSRPWGEDQLGQKEFLFLLPFISLSVFLINKFLSFFLIKEKNFFLAKISTAISFLVSFFCFFSLLKIIYLIT